MNMENDDRIKALETEIQRHKKHQMVVNWLFIIIFGILLFQFGRISGHITLICERLGELFDSNSELVDALDSFLLQLDQLFGF